MSVSNDGKWAAKFMDLAGQVSMWSKDQSTRVGAAIVDRQNRIVSVGFNGSPRGVKDADPGDRQQKLRRTIHAEANALHFALRSVEGHTIYVTHPPCAHCAGHIIQRGITSVVFNIPSADFLSRWADDYDEALKMFEEAGVTFSGRNHI